MKGRDVLLGVGIGAALAYMADPNNGRRRRALARDQMARATRKTRDAADATFRDMANRTRGIVAATRGRLQDEGVEDSRLVERVRAKLGRVTSHPRAIDVDARDGVVTLSGPILSSELSDVLSAVESVRGVREVVNNLEPHETAEGVPSLQGVGNVAGPSLDILQPNWAPATQALVAAGLAATGICMAAMVRRG